MPDRYGEPPEPDDYDDPDYWPDRHRSAQAARLAIAHCELCNDDGYRSGYVCDHIDHTEAARRGMALIRATMGWDK